MDTAYQKFETLFTAVEKEEQKQACCFTPDRGVHMGLNLMDLGKKKKNTLEINSCSTAFAITLCVS